MTNPGEARSGVWGRLGAAVLLAAILALPIFFWWSRAVAPQVVKHGNIVRFGQHPSRFGADRVAVVISLPNGAATELRPRAREVAGCRAGDRITYISDSTGLRVDRCTRPNP
jgi:hypothetical protein